MTKENVVNASHYGALESLLSGVTTVCDMYYFTSDVAKVLYKVGIRAFVGQTIVTDSQIDYQDEESTLKKCQELIETYKNHPLITPMIATHSPVTVSKKTLEKVSDLSIKLILKL